MRSQFGNRARERRARIGAGAMYESAFTRDIRRTVSRNRREVIRLLSLETQGPIHEKRATGHRQGIIDVRRHADTMDADTIEIHGRI